MHMISISFLNCYDLAKPNFGELHAAAVFVQGLDVWDAWSFFKLLDLDRGDSVPTFNIQLPLLCAGNDSLRNLKRRMYLSERMVSFG